MSLKVVAAKGFTELYLYDVIGPDGQGISHKAVVSALQGVKGPVKVRINSPGGEVSQGIGIYNALEEYSRTKGSVDGHIDAEASSIASVIAMACGTLTMSENAVWMMHRAWTFGAGNALDMEHVANYLHKVDNSQLVPAYTRKSGRSADDVRALMDAETWYTAAEALSAGFVDRIAPPGEVIALSPHASSFRLAAQRGEAGRPRSALGYGEYLSRTLAVRARTAR